MMSFKAANTDIGKQLDLIMTWNRPDIAKNTIVLFGDFKEVGSKLYQCTFRCKQQFNRRIIDG
jgi:hypothetical protein